MREINMMDLFKKLPKLKDSEFHSKFGLLQKPEFYGN
jgi:hypothetical protein